MPNSKWQAGLNFPHLLTRGIPQIFRIQTVFCKQMLMCHSQNNTLFEEKQVHCTVASSFRYLQIRNTVQLPIASGTCRYGTICKCRQQSWPASLNWPNDSGMFQAAGGGPMSLDESVQTQSSRQSEKPCSGNLSPGTCS